jgi:glucose 1-dehydrogenase
MLTDHVAIVSGASKGIGRATAIALARAGADVVLNYYSPNGAETPQAEAAADEIRALGRRAKLAPGDVSDQSYVDDLVATTLAEWGRLDHAITNAVYSDREPFHRADMAGFRRTIDVTMWGAFYLVRAAANAFLQQGRGGSIVIVSSPHAFIPVPNAMAYNMAKAALDQMAKTAAIELIDHKIRVNIIHPGWIDTPGERKFLPDEEIQRAGAMLPWGRMGRPEEIARGVVFFCDPASEYMTGANLLIDGGNTLPWWARSGMAVPS